MNQCWRVIVVLVILILSACDPSSSIRSTGNGSTKGSDKASEAKILAKVGNVEITHSELERMSGFELYDLEWQVYSLKKSALDVLVAEKLEELELTETEVEYFLEVPKRPRIDIETDNKVKRGVANAAIQLSVFCSYQSSHCVRLQPTLLRVLEEYQSELAISYFDYSQPFHRDGIALANAERCARSLSQEWDYHDHLLAKVTRYELNDLLSISGLLNLDKERFTECVNQRLHQQSIVEEIEYAGSLGLKTVPVIFVNGLYIRGPASYEEIRGVINQEIKRLYLTGKLNQGKKNEVVEGEKLPSQLEDLAGEDNSQLSEASHYDLASTNDDVLFDESGLPEESEAGDSDFENSDSGLDEEGELA